MPKCIVKDCSVVIDRKKPSGFALPIHPARREQWLDILNLQGQIFPKWGRFACRRHFSIVAITKMEQGVFDDDCVPDMNLTEDYPLCSLSSDSSLSIPQSVDLVFMSPRFCDLPEQEDPLLEIDVTECVPNKRRRSSELVFEERLDVDCEKSDFILISKSKLKELFKFCPKCGTQLGMIKVEIRTIGTAASLRYFCKGCKKEQQWTTQEYLGGRQVFDGNAKLGAACQLASLSPRRVIELFKLIKIGCIGESSFTRIARNYVWSVVEAAYRKEEKERFVELLYRKKENPEEKIILSGDGQYDSPGYSAKLMAYTILDVKTSLVVSTVTIDKNEVAVLHFNNAIREECPIIGTYSTKSKIYKGCIVKKRRKKRPSIKFKHDLLAKIVENIAEDDEDYEHEDNISDIDSEYDSFLSSDEFSDCSDIDMIDCD
ncbi:hypothetical protein FO519_009778 [Halicephalobus sp. NKZ332]|nr:hypothetical protein FO519_009778 [Halicephalobus sp. NKZ332]